MDRENIFIVAIVFVGLFLAGAFRRRPNRCPRCRELNREQARYCAQCGTQLPER